MADKAEKKEKETPVVKVDVDAFVARKLKDINEDDNEREKAFLAQRVLNNKRGKK